MKKYKQLIIKICVLGLILLFAGCNIPKAAQFVEVVLVANPAPQAWVDASLNNSVLPLAPYEIVFHITDQQEVTQGELSINNQVVAALPNPQAGKKLATLKYAWNPSAPGEYLLSVRAQGSSGNWGPVTTSKVFIGKRTPSLTMTMTSTGSPTPFPTPTPTATATITPTGLAGFSNVSAAPNAAYSGNCTPNQVSVSAQAVDNNGITTVVLFYRLRDANGNKTEWLNASMNPQGAEQYSKTVNVASAANQLGVANLNGTMEYQLVIQNKIGAYVRSQVYADVLVASCGATLPDIQIKPKSTADFSIFPTKKPIVK
jgi:hypothetical protein